MFEDRHEAEKISISLLYNFVCNFLAVSYIIEFTRPSVILYSINKIELQCADMAQICCKF